jgi:hypothetical protein
MGKHYSKSAEEKRRRSLGGEAASREAIREDRFPLEKGADIALQSYREIV